MIYRETMRVAFLVLVALLAAVGAGAARADEELVSFPTNVASGTIVVKTGERHLYLVLGSGRALRYPVGVGRTGKQWSGHKEIVAKFLKPAWMPPAEVTRDNPRLPDYIAGGTAGNPMGAAAMVLTGGEYAIHGTNRPNSIGGFVSYGCIRMFNPDIMRLYQRVGVGTPVVVVP